jgi:hypothetical protein
MRWLGHDAAKESNLPSRGLPGPASFEDLQEPFANAGPYWGSAPGGMKKGMTTPPLGFGQGAPRLGAGRFDTGPRADDPPEIGEREADAN